ALKQMKEPHNYRAVGWSMVAVAGSLAAIGLLILALHDDPFYSDNIMIEKIKQFEEMKQQTAEMVNSTSEKMVEPKPGMAILLVYLK
ncbi:MAG: hypothetical protein ACRD92_05005, partial [Nitrosopumilaceae archaeon]